MRAIEGSVVLVLMLLLVACSSLPTRSQTQSPIQPGVSGLISATDKAVANVGEYSVSIQRRVLDLASGNTSEIDIQGVCIPPDSYIVESTGDIGTANSTSLEEVVKNGVGYVRYNDEGWTEVKPPIRNPGMPSPSDYLAYFKDVSRLADQQVAGVMCTHLEAQADFGDLHWQPYPNESEVESDTKSNVNGGAKLKVDVWVGKTDSLPRKVSIVVEFAKPAAEAFPRSSQIVTSEERSFSYDQAAQIKITVPPPPGPIQW